MDTCQNTDVRGLIDLVYDDPEAVRRAAAVFYADPTSTEIDGMHARWAGGLAERELGQLHAAQALLEEALGVAEVLMDERVAARIATSLALTAAQLGDTGRAFVLLERAAGVDGVDRGHVLLQRALLQHRLGDLDAASRGYRSALDVFSEFDDGLATARTHLNIGVLEAYRGRLAVSLEHAKAAVKAAREVGPSMLLAQAHHNLGYVQARRGDIVAALVEMEVAEDQIAGFPGTDQMLAIAKADKASVLMQANLLTDAATEIEEARSALSDSDNIVERADVTYLAARCQRAAGNTDRAIELARESKHLFGMASRQRWIPRVDLLLHQLLPQAERRGSDGLRIAGALLAAGWPEDARVAYIGAARDFLRTGTAKRARASLVASRKVRRPALAAERIESAVATALLAEMDGDPGTARRSITNGLKLLNESVASLGGIELRARALAHGEELAQIGLRLAMRANRPLEFLQRVEAINDAVYSLPSARPPDDSVLSGLLDEMRTVTELSSATAAEDISQAPTRQRQQALERQIRDHVRRTRGGPNGAVDPVRRIGSAVDGVVVLEYAIVDDELIVAVVRGSIVRLRNLGSLSDVLRLRDSTDMALNRLSRSRVSAASAIAARELLAAACAEIEAMVLPADLLVDADKFVVVPVSELHGVPWSGLASFGGKPVSVSPSLACFLDGCQQNSTRRRNRVLVVAGPGLDQADDEADKVAELHEQTSHFDSQNSQVAQCLEGLESADLAHFACHGNFRADSPLFSSLRLADGNVTVYDLQRCKRLPRAVVLSACNAGQSAVLRGGALLGIASALIQLGVSSVIAPLTPVNDERSVDLMVRLHTHLAAGLEPSEALARAGTGPDGLPDPTAAPFICFGS